MTGAELAVLFLSTAAAHGLPPGLLESVCYVESHHKITAIRRHDGSPRTSFGLCQIQLRTARTLGYKGSASGLMDPSANVEYAARYLSYQIQRYRGDYSKAVTAYNAGTTKSHGGSKYLARVFNAYLKRYNEQFTQPNARIDEGSKK